MAPSGGEAKYVSDRPRIKDVDIRVGYIVVPEVYHNQTMFFVVHVDFVVVIEVYRDPTMIFVVYVNSVVTPMSIMTRRCSL